MTILVRDRAETRHASLVREPTSRMLDVDASARPRMRIVLQHATLLEVAQAELERDAVATSDHGVMRITHSAIADHPKRGQTVCSSAYVRTVRRTRSCTGSTIAEEQELAIGRVISTYGRWRLQIMEVDTARLGTSRASHRTACSTE